MDFDKLVFEIPIYRISREQFEKELLKSAKNVTLPKSTFKELYGVDESKEKYENHFKKQVLHKRYTWEYNEICGYVGIFFLSTQVRAEYYNVMTQRLRKGFTKKIEWAGKFFEISLLGNECSDKIYSLIKEELLLNMQSSFLKHRHLDLTKFRKIGKHVNWIDLMDENK